MRALLCAAILLTGCSESSESNLTIDTTALPDGRVQLTYQATLSAGGAVGAATWSVAAGELPPGIELGPGGALSGAPLRSGEYPFTVAVDDGAARATANLAVRVAPVALMSGFGPFEGYPVNPSIEALRPLDQQLIAGLDVRVIELPVEWDVSWTQLEAEIDRLGPSVAVGTGVAGSDAMRYETTAQNIEDGVDVANVGRTNVPVVPGGDATLPSELPLVELGAAVQAAGFKTTTSNSAGTYLCNFIFYHLAYRANTDDALLAGFIHVPPAPGGSFQIEDITAAHRVEIETLAGFVPALGP